MGTFMNSTPKQLGNQVRVGPNTKHSGTRGFTSASQHAGLAKQVSAVENPTKGTWGAANARTSNNLGTKRKLGSYNKAQE